MGTSTIAIVCAIIGLVVTPLYIVFIVKGVRSLKDLKNVFSAPASNKNTRR